MKLHERKYFMEPEIFTKDACQSFHEEGKAWQDSFDPERVFMTNTLFQFIHEFFNSERKNRLKQLVNVMRMGIEKREDYAFTAAPDTDYETVTYCSFLPGESEEEAGRILFYGLSYFHDTTQALPGLPPGYQREQAGVYIVYRDAERLPHSKILQGSPLRSDEEVENIHIGIIATVMFMRYVEIRKAFVAHKKKQKIKGQPAVKNRTGRPFIVADVNWAYDVKRSVPFAVRGHWRMQRIGEGRQKMRMIWIEAFQKSGYQRKAGVRRLQGGENSHSDPTDTEAKNRTQNKN